MPTNILLEFLFSATSIWFVVGFVAGMFVLWFPRILKRRLLRERVGTAYYKLRRVCEPETLNPDEPGNMEFMRSDARDTANEIATKLKSAGFYPPRKCTNNDASFRVWFEFLGDVRMEIATWV